MIFAVFLQMFAIGVGNNTNDEELNDISSGPDYVLNANDFSALSDIRRTLLTEACKGIISFVTSFVHVYCDTVTNTVYVRLS